MINSMLKRAFAENARLFGVILKKLKQNFIIYDVYVVHEEFCLYGSFD